MMKNIVILLLLIPFIWSQCSWNTTGTYFSTILGSLSNGANYTVGLGQTLLLDTSTGPSTFSLGTLEVRGTLIVVPQAGNMTFRMDILFVNGGTLKVGDAACAIPTTTKINFIFGNAWSQNVLGGSFRGLF